MTSFLFILGLNNNNLENDLIKEDELIYFIFKLIDSMITLNDCLKYWAISGRHGNAFLRLQ